MTVVLVYWSLQYLTVQLALHCPDRSVQQQQQLFPEYSTSSYLNSSYLLQGHWSILLDGKRVKTPSSEPLSVPSRLLACAIAAEFQYQSSEYVRLSPWLLYLCSWLVYLCPGCFSPPIGSINLSLLKW